VTDPNDQGKFGLELCNGVKKIYVSKARDLLGSFLVLPCSVIKNSGKTAIQSRENYE
jgi:hypothetical protein